MTFEEAKKYHVELWQWLSEKGSIRKNDWPGWYYHSIYNILNDCFACVYASKVAGSEDTDEVCACCPIDWPKIYIANIYGAVPCEKSLYKLWGVAESIDERKIYAKQIAELPWQEKEYAWANIENTK